MKEADGRFARAGEQTLHYRIDGDGPWLTMAHSLAASSAMWQPQLAALTPHYEVLRIDTRGHGRSGIPQADSQVDCTLEDLADDVHGLFRELGIAQSHWVGISPGGMVGQSFALKYPGVLTSLVLADTMARAAPGAAAVWAQRIAAARANGMRRLVEGTLAR